MNAEGVVAEFIAALARGDIDGAMGYVAQDAEYDNVPMSKAIGHEQIRGVLAMFVGPDNPLEFKVVRQAASGNLVMNERIDCLTVGGKRVELPVAGVWEVDPATSKITLWRDYFDMGQFNSQMA
jgi:limonene-1,2-epoxide hydrolase